MQESLIAQGVDLMFYGMGTVIVFLALLVVITTAMSVLVNRFFPEPEPPTSQFRRPVPATPARVDDRVVNVIREAIQQHRSRKGR